MAKQMRNSRPITCRIANQRSRQIYYQLQRREINCPSNFGIEDLTNFINEACRKYGLEVTVELMCLIEEWLEGKRVIPLTSDSHHPTTKNALIKLRELKFIVYDEFRNVAVIDEEMLLTWLVEIF